MNDFIKQMKQSYLAQLKNQYQILQNSKQAKVSEKYAAKKATSDVRARELDEALSRFIAESQAALNARIEQEKAKTNDEIALKRQEVADKKANIDEMVKKEAESEVEAELFAQSAEILQEIEKTEKELA